MAAATCNRLISLTNSGQWTDAMPTSPFPNHHLKKKKQCCQSAQEILSHTGRSLSKPDGSHTGIPGFPSSADSFEAFDAIARDNQTTGRAPREEASASSALAPSARANETSSRRMGGHGRPTRKICGLHPCCCSHVMVAPTL